LSSLWLACASTMSDGYPPDFSVQFDALSHLMRSETTVKVTGDSLLLYHKSSQLKEPIDDTYKLDALEVKEFYKFLEEIDFHAMQPPKSERMLDAPEVSITAVYNGKRTSIAIGSVKEIPQSVQQCRQRIFELANKYDRRMKNILGF